MKLVKINNKVKNTLKFAGIEPSGKFINIKTIEEACLKNSKRIDIPIEYQYLWYALHNATIKRKALSGKFIKSKVSFCPIHIESTPKIRNLIKKATKACGTTRNFSKYVNRDESCVSNYIYGRTKPPITVIMKACQILNLGFVNIIKNCMFYGQDSTKEESIKFDNQLFDTLRKLSPIIKTEGHVEVSKPHVEIKQEIIGIDTLLEIKDMLNFLPQKIELKTVKTGNRKYLRLRFSSAVIRQFLCLFFDMEIGYKCKTVNILRDMKYCKTWENKKYLLSKCLEFDGGFCQNKKIAFSCRSDMFIDNIYELMSELGYNATRDKTRTTIHKLDGVIKCVFDMLPYIKHKSRINMINKWLNDPKLLTRLRIQGSFELKKLTIQSREKISKSKYKNLELAKYLSEKTNLNFNRKDTSKWLHNYSAPLIAVAEMCNLLNKSYFDYIPKHYSIVLWHNKFITKDTLEKMRGKNISYFTDFPTFSNFN